MTPPRAVLLMRHAHAESPGYAGTDFDRPLTPAGEQEAALAAAAMRAAGHMPALILASPARRTLQTARIMARTLAVPADAVQAVESLYNASADTLAAELHRATAGTTGLVAVVAHNPGISELARELSPGATPFAPARWRLVTLRQPSGDATT